MTNFNDFNYSDDLEIDDTISFLQEACIHPNSMKPEFNRIEMEEIFSVLVDVPESLLPMNTPADSIDIKRYHYLKEKYTRMNRFSKHKNIQHRVSYFIKMIKTDCGRD